MLFDPLYWIIIGITFALSGIASWMVRSRFRRGMEVPVRSGMTGADIARAILRAEDIRDVTVAEHQGFLSDHYNPANKTLNLSPEVYHGRTAAAAGVAAHEVGHAIQHAHGYMPLQLRSVLVPAAQFGSSLGPWVVIGGIFMGATQEAAQGIFGMGSLIALLGVILFAGAFLFALVTVPVEYDASARAKQILQREGLVRDGEEADTVRGVLSAAGLTYVAAAVASLLQLLYWALVAGLLGERD